MNSGWAIALIVLIGVARAAWWAIKALVVAVGLLCGFALDMLAFAEREGRETVRRSAGPPWW